ncbi:granulocyte-macrophage colony-stimulating factor receptor subunit alpha-like isoform X2 [Thalassophryne amazonica]|uniref:granulocyte-macrophage colony-stimulating factor receptor subunit alpha-like isoform X2 n=1 Tax=Thalassophryne amazonica TaxID=390379 RepID=UPI001470C677|nr:granulocyte-macrophage colony-stimulating factor receptor subunit alpha-like isoform X2 [Thalassophryne amazonica]
MRRVLVHYVLWSIVQVLDASQCDRLDDDVDVCQENLGSNDLIKLKKHEMPHEIDSDETYSCLLYPTNILNCSWSVQGLPNQSQLCVHLCICQGKKTVQTLNFPCDWTVGSHSELQPDLKTFDVIFLFNVSLQNSWVVYADKYDAYMLEVLSPPPNISAAVRDGGLLVTWDLPHTRVAYAAACFEYELNIDDPQGSNIFTDKQSYTESNIDPTRAHKVRMRTRTHSTCHGSNHWSAWSHTVMVENSVQTLNTAVIISISLGVPMILLAVLLVFRLQRVNKILFPPVPCPPPEYKNFLEKNEPFNFSHPPHLTKNEEVITEVEDAH